jgi:hypothetical protein
MEHVDRVAARVSLGALTGLFGGAVYATLKGFPRRATSLKVAGSFALVGTALFGLERIAYVAMQDQMESERRLILTSHAFAGVFGGGLNGHLYQKKPLRGMFYFIPIMIGIAFLELGWEEKKQQRLKTLLEGENDRSDEALKSELDSNESI